ncbi:hypothetical protein GCM10007916_28740 [Psychromonas marina]|uniref:Uncharacterized protein n=1 Tax=Psychromonas marina TaxID=88364 RepID=A0ABQ6E302_9GAMM|nr:hypothetical protein [Psychromonas marina]GLS91804.1 hypothetical protein GCM10007916_28740 [Psychromonas marina]
MNKMLVVSLVVFSFSPHLFANESAFASWTGKVPQRMYPMKVINGAFKLKKDVNFLYDLKEASKGQIIYMYKL